MPMPQPPPHRSKYIVAVLEQERTQRNSHVVDCKISIRALSRPPHPPWCLPACLVEWHHIHDALYSYENDERSCLLYYHIPSPSLRQRA